VVDGLEVQVADCAFESQIQFFPEEVLLPLDDEGCHAGEGGCHYSVGYVVDSTPGFLEEDLVDAVADTAVSVVADYCIAAVDTLEGFHDIDLAIAAGTETAVADIVVVAVAMGVVE
jgi:hypothetical protein